MLVHMDAAQQEAERDEVDRAVVHEQQMSVARRDGAEEAQEQFQFDVRFDNNQARIRQEERKQDSKMKDL